MSNPKARIRQANSERLKDRPFPVLTLAEMREISRTHGCLRDGDSWGPWAWNATAGTLDYTGGAHAGSPYSVDIRRVLDTDNPAGAAWDWVRHIAGKNWEPPALRCFVLALRHFVGTHHQYERHHTD